ncbi:hypothetical protein N7516_010458 [Penicillium verrucosum]|uniref:uncharacterized protein n=1 Tax=Penicillium verrucosum TaxID=60171 RepID=UPI002544EAFE|nr:uncharacterized protein N7516_010458 [Penicillium verrucosum]KAJ5922755.1 hypothetical protein N7516_010458 [Penicillium verrucosum]
MKVFTTTVTLILSSLTLLTGAISSGMFASLESLGEIADFYNQLEGATLKLRSNETHAFDYSLVYDNGTIETNKKVTIALPSSEIEHDAEDEKVDKRANQSCFNKQNRSKGAGCPVNKGLGYSSGHNCKSIFRGKMYSCQIRCPDGEGGNDCFVEECIKVNQAGGLEGGYCYN